MSRGHSLCSPSSLERRDQCSASCFEESKLKGTDDENSKRGTRLHKLMEYRLAGKLSLDSLSEDERNAVSKAWEMAEQALGDELFPNGKTLNGGSWISEQCMEAVSTAAPGYKDWGTCDLVVIYEREKRIVLLDWKFGGGLVHHPKWNLQLQDYLCMLWDKFGYDYSMETTYIQPSAQENYDINPWHFEPNDRHRIVAKIKEIRERAYGNQREYVVGPACDMCEAARQRTCWARHQVFRGILPIVGLQDASGLGPVELGRALDAAEVVRRDGDRIWDMLKKAVFGGSIADGWMHSPTGNRLYRKVTERNRVSQPIHLRKPDQ